MTFSSAMRKFGLTTHIAFSAGWFGGVAGFFVLAIAGLVSKNSQLVTANYISMEMLGWFAIVPFCMGTFFSGVLQSLGTEWGLFKHYWIAVKLVLTVIATIVLFVHMQPVSHVADIASKDGLTNTQLRGLRIQLIADAGAALLVILVAIGLSVYKPWGRIKYEYGVAQETWTIPVTGTRKWLLYLIALLILLVLFLFAYMHVSENGFSHH